MNIKKMIQHYILGDSLKEIEINRILNKICSKSKLTTKERSFLDLYNETQKLNDNRDYMLLSKSVVANRISELISKGKKVICDLHDRDGKIGLEIIDVRNDYDLDTYTLIMKSSIKQNLHDKFLYNLIYNIKKNLYSLQEHDEYYEKIEVDK